MALKITDVNHLIGIASPWEVTEIEQETSRYAARIHVALSGDAELRCPECGKVCPGYDHREGHTNICDYRTEVAACAVSTAWCEYNFGSLGRCSCAIHVHV